MRPARVSRSGIPLDASPETHERVLAWFASWARGKVLDCPAGQGALAHELTLMGYRVVAADLRSASPPGSAFSRALIDLNGPLPFRDGSFDAVACVEGIEHLERPVDALREFRRVLAPGGKLVLTTPNVLHLGSRVRMLLTGFWTAAPRPFDGSRPASGLEHIMLMSYPLLRYFLERAGFVIERVERNRVVRGSLPWAWLVVPVALATRLALRHAADRAVARRLLDRALLFGHALLFLCRTTEQNDGSSSRRV